MSKSPQPEQSSEPDWSTISERIAWLVDSRYYGNKSAMASTIGFSHTIVSRVIRGANPGPRLLDAIVKQLHVDSTWLRTGLGQPFVDLANNSTNSMPVTTLLLPGPPQHHQDKLTHWITVPEIISSSSRYWLTLLSAQPIVRQSSSGFRSGDKLLMETDPAKFPAESDLHSSLCVVQIAESGDELKLTTVQYHPASFDNGDARLEAETPERAITEQPGVEHVYRHYPNGTIEHQERTMIDIRSFNTLRAETTIRYTQIISIWLKILFRQ